MLVTVTTSFGQLFLKQGADTLPSLLSNTPLLAGILLYGISALLFILALRGGDVSVLIPILATNFIWVALLGMLVLGEPMNTLKWLGMIIVFSGVSVVGIGGAK